MVFSQVGRIGQCLRSFYRYTRVGFPRYYFTDFQTNDQVTEDDFRISGFYDCWWALANLIQERWFSYIIYRSLALQKKIFFFLTYSYQFNFNISIDSTSECKADADRLMKFYNVPVRQLVGIETGQAHGIEEFTITASDQTWMSVNAGNQSTAIAWYRESEE